MFILDINAKYDVIEAQGKVIKDEEHQIQNY